MGYISIDVIDAEIRGRLKSYNEQGRIDPDDVVQYTYDAMRKLGLASYMEDAWVGLEIVDNKAIIPNDIYTTNSAYRLQNSVVGSFNNLFTISTNVTTSTETDTEETTCTTGTTTTTTTTTVVMKESCDGEAQFVYTAKTVPLSEIVSVLNLSYPMYYTGSELSLITSAESNVYLSGMDTYIYRGNNIITSFKSGNVIISYKRWVKDADGRPMVPDDIDTIDAVIAYNIFMLVSDDFYDRKENVNTVYSEAKNNWDNFKAQAQNTSKLITIDEAQAKVIANANRYRRFRLR